MPKFIVECSNAPTERGPDLCALLLIRVEVVAPDERQAWQVVQAWLPEAVLSQFNPVGRFDEVVLCLNRTISAAPAATRLQ